MTPARLKAKHPKHLSHAVQARTAEPAEQLLRTMSRKGQPDRALRWRIFGFTITAATNWRTAKDDRRVLVISYTRTGLPGELRVDA